MTKILVSYFSLRKASFTRKLADNVETLLSDLQQTPHMLSLEDYPLPIYDGDYEALYGPPDNVQKIGDIFTQHSGWIMVGPEYNGSFSPLFKNLIDWLSRLKSSKEIFCYRPVFLMSLSAGPFGGMRCVMHMEDVLKKLECIVTPNNYLIPRCNNAFDENGVLIKDVKILHNSLQSFLNLVTKLKG